MDLLLYLYVLDRCNAITRFDSVVGAPRRVASQCDRERAFEIKSLIPASCHALGRPFTSLLRWASKVCGTCVFLLYFQVYIS